MESFEIHLNRKPISLEYIENDKNCHFDVLYAKYIDRHSINRNQCTPMCMRFLWLFFFDVVVAVFLLHIMDIDTILKIKNK